MLNKLKLKIPNINYVTLPVLFALLLVAYISFTGYKPKSLIEVREVKGSRTKQISIPTPRNATKTSDNKINANRQQITLKSDAPGKEIQRFYSNIMLSKGWRIDKEGNEGVFYTTKYRKNGDTIVVSTTSEESSQDGKSVTIAVIDIDKAN